MAMFPLKLMERIIPYFFLAPGDFLGIPWLMATSLQYLPVLSVITWNSHCVSLCSLPIKTQVTSN